MTMLHGTRRALLGTHRFRGAYDGIANLVHIYEPARRTLTAYIGSLVRLRRASDDAEADFGYLANGNLDTAAIAAWAGGASYIVTVYDQIGGDDVTQGTAANQPFFTANMLNGRAGGFYDGTDDYLQGAYTTGGALSQPYSIYAVSQLDATRVDDNVPSLVFDGDDTTNRAAFAKQTAAIPDKWQIYAGVALVSNPCNANWNILSVLFNGNSSEYWINTVSQAAGAAGTQNPDGLTIGGNFGGIETWKGYIGPVIIVDPAHSDAQRVAMQNIINAYYAVY